ncbi:sensor histidine kinase [Phreatobacter stygius]|uniref:histidine kinase n=1 Tax=Phreatobacter stygius TaxID=1940610 RepID=A0A4D7BCN3_9HYPH|nr:sensor histidine kinase [Phreatobacter stygius]QCI67778.1 hypothetical protein E8M01_28270 [Phreatobacter stygius]
MKLSKFQTVRGRLIGLLVLIAVPMALLAATAAVTTYRTVLGSIEDRQLEAAANYAVRTRIWYDGALRALLATVAGVEATGLTDPQCDAIGRQVLAGTQDDQALRLRFANGTSCLASRNGALSAETLDAMTRTLTSRPIVQDLPGAASTTARYDYVDIDGKHYLAIHATGGGAGTGWEGLYVTDVAALERAFDLGALAAGAVVGLIGRSDQILIARGADEKDVSWLPEGSISRTGEPFEAASRAGARRSYSVQRIAEPDLYVLASLDQTVTRAAQTQFLALLIIPLATLALLCAVYLHAIHSHILRWLRGIEQAARQEEQSSFTARALVAEEMPSDIKSVARAFNGMVDAQEQRQHALQTALDRNRLLVRELHHRVKNSLQIVQSYLSLAKRNHSTEAKLALSEAECRVQVLAIAYRFALAEGEMHVVRVDAFLDEVLATISRLLSRPGQLVEGQIASQASLPIDRLIPLGLLVVEVVSRCLWTIQGVHIIARVVDLNPNAAKKAFELKLTADRDVALGPQPKMLAGLAMQIEAVQPVPATAADLGTWQVTT